MPILTISFLRRFRLFLYSYLFENLDITQSTMGTLSPKSKLYIVYKRLSVCGVRSHGPDSHLIELVGVHFYIGNYYLRPPLLSRWIASRNEIASSLD